MTSLTDINFAPFRFRRSVLSVPASNQRALEKIRTLDCDAVIFDLEDSVAPEKKAEARENLRRLFKDNPLQGVERVVRINALDTQFGKADMDLAVEISPDVVLVPKVEQVAQIQSVADILSEAGAPDDLAIWAMIETPKGVLNASAIGAADERLQCFVVGLNDLRKETGVLSQPGRGYLVPWLMQIVLAGRAHGIDIIDSVFNDFRDTEALEAECRQGRVMGFSGKMLIHPAQIEPANRHFGPDPEAVKDAETIIAAFAKPEARHLNVINLNGQMVERLHLVEAEKLVAKAKFLTERKNAP
ncbi:citrate lyase subunit beta/citryl-CoA lyase [Neorhizobium sp. R1-B]|jgi:citrate lyase subunit beta / citryl-CoA lyase|uniref:HpcH/HpaI aldolase/citrate lyase family protein n=1 Tax=Neorhizobium TaxID=1525371 RepID=UPI000CFA4182|nr:MULTISPECIES: CoA ester lyase [Neorhizobium]TCV70436.1 citrate lyase subunit beta/citryl-CoA lyase [Neorhizobium sp. S3-V5DH]TDX81910.1 citrate lyase subunit beta/citryl-CoA lyase [Neorhizobium sp. R1-B]